MLRWVLFLLISTPAFAAEDLDALERAHEICYQFRLAPAGCVMPLLARHTNPQHQRVCTVDEPVVFDAGHQECVGIETRWKASEAARNAALQEKIAAAKERLAKQSADDAAWLKEYSKK